MHMSENINFFKLNFEYIIFLTYNNVNPYKASVKDENQCIKIVMTMVVNE